MTKEPKLKKGQKCWHCGKIIKRKFAYNGHYFHENCLVDSAIKKYLKQLK